MRKFFSLSAGCKRKKISSLSQPTEVKKVKSLTLKKEEKLKDLNKKVDDFLKQKRTDKFGRIDKRKELVSEANEVVVKVLPRKRIYKSIGSEKACLICIRRKDNAVHNFWFPNSLVERLQFDNNYVKLSIPIHFKLRPLEFNLSSGKLSPVESGPAEISVEELELNYKFSPSSLAAHDTKKILESMLEGADNDEEVFTKESDREDLNQYDGQNPEGDEDPENEDSLGQSA